MTQLDTVPFDELLRHRAWVRALARSLVRDGSSADDVEQEVWVRALRAPPRHGWAVRSWLGRVVRNVVHDRFRSDSRRTAREVAQPPRPESESTFDVVARTEAHRDLVSEVLALPEPYRRAILMHFFDGLTPAEIAARTGIAPETARKQVQRARAMLRERLARRPGGRSAVLLPILGGPALVPPGLPGAESPVTGTEWTASVAGGVAVGAKSKSIVAMLIVLLLLLMGGIGAVVLTGDGTDDDATDVAGAGTAAGGVALAGIDGADGLAGRDGADASGAPGSAEDARKERHARERVTPTTSDADGEDATAARTDGANSPNPLIQGVVTAADTGEPIEGVPVYVFDVRRSSYGAIAVGHTDTDGRFLINNVHAGTYEVQFGYRMSMHETSFEWVTQRIADITAGGDEMSVKLDRGLEIAGRLVDAHNAIVEGDFTIRVTGRTQAGDRDQSRARLLRTVGDGTFRIAGLEEGLYDITLSPADVQEGEEAPRLGGTMSVEAVTAGTTDIVVRLGRAETISGTLTDEDGQPIAATKGWMQAVPASEVPGGPGTVWIKFAADGTFTSPPLDANRSYDLQAGGVPGHRLGRLEGIAPGATDVVVRMPRGTSISGVVKQADGKPAPRGIPVLAIAEDVSLGGTQGAVAFAYTDKDGAFIIEGLGEFTYQVAAGGGQSSWRVKMPLRGVKYGSKGQVLEVLPGEVFAGKLLDADGKPVKAPYLTATQPGLLQQEAYTRVESADGSFSIRGLPPGTFNVAVVINDQRIELGAFDVPAKDVELRLPRR